MRSRSIWAHLLTLLKVVWINNLMWNYYALINLWPYQQKCHYDELAIYDVFNQVRCILTGKRCSSRQLNDKMNTVQQSTSISINGIAKSKWIL